MESTHDRVVASSPLRHQQFYLADVHRKEVTRMTVYETIMVVLGVIGSLISLSMLIIALLTFFISRNGKQ